MERILVLRTGAGISINCYNTCFILENNEKYLLVDTGSRSGILKQIRDMGVDITKIHDLFISHKHIDHLLGIFVFIRMITSLMGVGKYEGDLNIYCDSEIKELVNNFFIPTSYPQLIEQYNKHIKYHDLKNSNKFNIIEYEIEVLDMYSKECNQYGFQTKLNNGKILTFMGDVPCSEKLYEKIRNTDWVLHEAFCLEAEEEIFKAREKHHSTVKDVAEKMELLNVKNIVLWHTKDNNIEKRKELYTNEAKEYFKGNVYVPNDLEIIEL